LEVVGLGVAGHFHRLPGGPDSTQVRLPTFVPFEVHHAMDDIAVHPDRVSSAAVHGCTVISATASREELTVGS
jgi:hypothetical protein